ncbi:DnaT-like ssDNA-binding domain-containing protein [Pantoea sp. V106_11]|uniref:DnaT-like ssDNA-binding domain-containing protein n=1 Tax=Pantoea sp. V106_11 TaxID=3044234 RepID=UPI00249DCDCC|nr:DnaT-like ssDNA-binding domain-containing protein [Pantoea sp. V106_11]MDI3415673.1 DnaT-like ssDNA-binding domain-containing protein [Pantoea sp. V106_11]
MAGDWIKMRADLHTHPKVVRMASALKADRLRIVGGLHSAWCLFDVHSVDGFLEGYSPDTLDDLIGFPGFSRAMINVGWLEESDESLVMPRFDAHNGQSAKRRAQDADRKRERRNVSKTSASEADKLRTREEKRREDKDQTPYITREEKFPTSQVSHPSQVQPVNVPSGKFMLTRDWVPSPDFFMKAAQWGVILNPDEFKPEHLTSFLDYWIGEGKAFTHVQWEQKFARQLERIKNETAKQKGKTGLDFSNTDWIHPIRDEYA